MKHNFFIFLSSALFFGCTSLSMDKVEYANYSILHSEDSGFFDIGKFGTHDVGILGLDNHTELLFFLDKNITYRAAVIKYMTEDPDGNPIEASGLVFHPLNKKSKGVVVSLPTARIGSVGPSDEIFAIEGVMVYRGYTVIMPDLLGFGVSKGSTKAPFLMTHNTGKVTYDMHRAAAQYLWDTFAYSIPSKTTIVGYSLGGSAALSVQKYYETYQSHSIKVKEVHAGGGAYDLPTAFSVFSQTRYSEYPSIPKTILTFDHFYHLNIDFEKVFVGELLNNYQDWYSGIYSIAELMERLGSNIESYMHPDFFKPMGQQNEEFEKLYPYLVENSVSMGWSPKAPVYLIHAKNDTYVPVECAQVAVRNFRRSGSNVSFTIYPSNHLLIGLFYFFETLLRYL